MNFSATTVARLPVWFRLGIFVLILLLLWLPLALPIYTLWGTGNTPSLVATTILYVEFIVLLRQWAKRLYHQAQPLQFYGLDWSWQNGQDLLSGLGLGLISLSGLFGLETILGWLNWGASPHLSRIILEGLGVALAVGLAEELLFRGWLLQELERDYSPRTALWVNSVSFAVLHFIRPLELILQTWTQFLGLILLAVNLVLAKRLGRGRLGWAIGLHAGLVWGYYIVNVGKLFTYTDRAPVWMTGINNNPLAGGMGLIFLGSLVWVMTKLQPHGVHCKN